MVKKGRGIRLTAMVIAVVMLIGLLAACTGGNNNQGDPNQERVLRIATMGWGPDQEWVRREFTEIFEFVNQNITIEIVSTYDDSMRYGTVDQQEQKQPIELLNEMLDGANPPDIVLMNLEDVSQLTRDGRLQPLEPLIQNSKLNMDELVPAVVEGLKKQSDDGNLYALAPMFSASALAYNKKIFTDANVPFPEDGMTWDDIFNLARQLSSGEGDDRTYGFSFTNYRHSDLFYDMNVFTAPLQLQMYDALGEKMTVNTQDWKNIWNTVISLRKENVLPEPPNYENMDYSRPMGPYEYSSMLSGKVAMSIVNYWDLSEIINANKNAANIENFTAIDWDIVSVPSHPQAPGVGGYVYLNGVLGITNNAQNSADAWKFIEFIMSEDWAKTKSKSVSQLVSWKKYNEPQAGLDYNIEAFFHNTPVVDTMYNSQLYRDKPDIWQVNNIGQMKFSAVLNEEKTVDEALAEWETEGDAILQKLKENDGRLNPEDGGVGLFMSDEKLRLMEASGEIVVSEPTEAPAVEEEVAE